MLRALTGYTRTSLCTSVHRQMKAAKVFVPRHCQYTVVYYNIVEKRRSLLLWLLLLLASFHPEKENPAIT